LVAGSRPAVAPPNEWFMLTTWPKACDQDIVWCGHVAA
jgi:hypothetical protein